MSRQQTIAALINREEKLVIVPMTPNYKAQFHAIQCFGERFLSELLIMSSAPGEIELNPNYTWKFVLDEGLYSVDHEMQPILMYKFQQH